LFFATKIVQLRRNSFVLKFDPSLEALAGASRDPKSEGVVEKKLSAWNLLEIDKK
jgi:hypothetical protein